MPYRSISTIDLAANSIDVPPPSGIVNGDILIAFAISDSNATTFTWPAGFTEITGSPLTSTADGSRLGVATKKASGESGNYTLTQTGSDAIIGGVVCCSGEDGTLFLHRISSGVQSTAQASAWSITSGTFSGGNTTGTCDLIFIGDSDVTALSDAVHTGPSGFTVRSDLADSTSPGNAFSQGMVSTKDSVSSGETGAYTGTGTAAGITSGWCVFVIALLQAATGSPPPKRDLAHTQQHQAILAQ